MWSRARGLRRPRPRRRVPDDGKRTSEPGEFAGWIANSSRTTRNTEQTHTHWTAAKQKRENRQADYQKHRLFLFSARPTFTPHAPSDTELFGILGGYNWHRPLFSSSSLLSVTKTEPFSLVWFSLIPLFFLKAKSRHHCCYWSHAFTLIIMWFRVREQEKAVAIYWIGKFDFRGASILVTTVLTTGFDWKKMAAFFSLLFC